MFRLRNYDKKGQPARGKEENFFKNQKGRESRIFFALAFCRSKTVVFKNVGEFLSKFTPSQISESMNFFLKTCLVFLAAFLFANCNRKIQPDRTQFIKDGDEVPELNLAQYKSVQERPHQRPELAVAIAISGGGSRAANFGLGALLGLEEILLPDSSNALAEIDYFSTVSGGGFAGGAYIAALCDHHYFEDKEPFFLKNHVETSIQNDLKHSFTGDIFKADINPRFLFSYLDDGDVLEKSIDTHVLRFRDRHKKDRQRGQRSKKRSILLGDLFIDKDSLDKQVLFPMQFANSTILGKMVRFPFSPDILKTYRIVGYTHRLKNITAEKLNPYLVPLAVGIKASGSFPVLISNTTLFSSYSKTRPYLHLIDGGLADNIGYQTAIEVLKQDPASKKILFLIDADNGGNRFTYSHKRGAEFSLKVLSRLPSSGLDSRRVTLEKDVREKCRELGIIPIFLSFNILIRNNDTPPPNLIVRKEEQKELLRLLKDDMENLPPKYLQILYELLVNIGTKYNIKEEEQKLLLLGGQKVVLMQKQAIQRMMAQ